MKKRLDLGATCEHSIRVSIERTHRRQPEIFTTFHRNLPQLRVKAWVLWLLVVVAVLALSSYNDHLTIPGPPFRSTQFKLDSEYPGSKKFVGTANGSEGLDNFVPFQHRWWVDYLFGRAENVHIKLIRVPFLASALYSPSPIFRKFVSWKVSTACAARKIWEKVSAKDEHSMLQRIQIIRKSARVCTLSLLPYLPGRI